ncbi:hypothetical protein C2845_PM02G35630 [Panicum miliaceum]|uniref:Uncharacterized protein n=1 Tax=Panicum miliaceum TaxID=4540 RepID=A0A3L6SFR3_PANMI|nr:hypothetical protein C2845_PM02G35630 [Panicum miliaceum]
MDEDDGRFVARAWRRWLGEVLARVTPLRDEEHVKVVDMFGCGLPVCAASFSCIEELVKVNKNGLLFSTSSELADELMMLFKGFPEECDALKSFKEGAMDTASSSKWSTEWETNALPLVNQASAQTSVTGIVINTHKLRPYLLSYPNLQKIQFSDNVFRQF